MADRCGGGTCVRAEERRVCELERGEAGRTGRGVRARRKISEGERELESVRMQSCGRACGVSGRARVYGGVQGSEGVQGVRVNATASLTLGKSRVVRTGRCGGVAGRGQCTRCPESPEASTLFALAAAHKCVKLQLVYKLMQECGRAGRRGRRVCPRDGSARAGRREVRQDGNSPHLPSLARQRCPYTTVPRDTYYNKRIKRRAYSKA